MGPVEINNDHLDRGVVVIFNKKWKGNYSDDIIAAFKPNIEAKKIETFSYSSIRIFRNEEPSEWANSRATARSTGECGRSRHDRAQCYCLYRLRSWINRRAQRILYIKRYKE